MLGTMIQVQFLSKAFKEAGVQPMRGYLSDAKSSDMVSPMNTTAFKWSETIFPYQLCSAIYSQRHKKYLIHASSKMLEGYTITSMSTIDTSKGGPVKDSGGRLGRLDAATESGMFHKVNLAKLKKFKKTLKDKPIAKKSTPDPAKKSEE